MRPGTVTAGATRGLRWTGRIPFAGSRKPRVETCGAKVSRYTLMIGLFVLRCLSTVAVPVDAKDLETEQALRRALTTGETVAFVKGNRIRVYWSGEDGRVVFEARWKTGPLDGRELSYYTGELKIDEAPPRMPGSKSAWCEVTVLDPDTWRRYVGRAREALVPKEPGGAIYVQSMDGDRVFLRDSKGEIQSLHLRDKPAETNFVRRYNAHEFAARIAEGVEAELHANYPAEARFLGAYQTHSSAPRFMLLDFPRQLCVVLHGPLNGASRNGDLPFSAELAIATSFTLESHGLALLKNPISSVGRLLNTGVQSFARLATPRLPSFSTPVPALNGKAGMDLGEWESYLDKATGTKTDPGSMTFIIDGENFFPLFRRRLEEARKSVHLILCIFDNDDVAVEIADLLKGLSRDMDVKVLLDRLNTQTSCYSPPKTLPEGFVPPKSIRSYLKQDSQVKVRAFLNPWFSSEHSKVFLIDGRFAYIGGMNIGREYRYEWHDMMAELEGPIVSTLERDFRRAWAHASPLGDLAYAGSVLRGSRPEAGDRDTGNGKVALRRLYTRTGSQQIRKAAVEAIRRAERYVFLENPYLSDNTVVAALVLARRRGVDVRVVLPLGTDIPGVNSSNFVTANDLLKNGVRVYLYPGMTHIKALIADGWACVGSANFNHLSLRLNQEVNVATSDALTVERLRRDLFEVDFEKSHELLEPLPVGWADHLVEELMNWF